MIWLIQFKHPSYGGWVATGQPCYSLLEARAKLKRYRGQDKSKPFRIAQYVEHSTYAE
jgi:hypothetical protein